jgi:heme-degrading monooxygenase HmoA
VSPAELLNGVGGGGEVIEAVPGCLGVDCWLDKDGTAIVTTGKWESEQAFIAGFAAAREAGVDFTYDEREVRPREIFRLSRA